MVELTHVQEAGGGEGGANVGVAGGGGGGAWRADRAEDSTAELRGPRLWSSQARRLAGLVAVFPSPKGNPSTTPRRQANKNTLSYIQERQMLALKDFLSPETPSALSVEVGHSGAGAAPGGGVLPPLENPLRAEDDSSSDAPGGESVHSALRPLLVAGQCFGVLPVRGVTGASPVHLSFCSRAKRSLWAMAVAAALAVVCAASVTHVVQALRGGTSGFMKGVGTATSGVVFYGVNTVTVLLFLRLAPRWPRLMGTWSAVERAQAPMIGWPPVRRRARATAVTIFLLSYVEHVFSILVRVPECLQMAPCDFLRLYITRSHAFLFSSPRAVPYSAWLGVPIVFVSELGTFAWNFLDVFVIVVSGALAVRLAAINKRLVGCDLQLVTPEDWGRFREAYAATSALVKMVDANICSVVLLSFSSNLYFICLQLLNGLSPKSTSALDYVYFLGSFGYLVGRTVALTLTAAWIHDESRLALPQLFQCPTRSYCLETQRLQNQLVSDEVVLTGQHFFSITRSFLLAVAGAIVTYEVILLQFDMPSSSGSCNSTSLFTRASDTGISTTSSPVTT